MDEPVISDFVLVERMPGFECTRCGACCRDRVIVLFEEDVRRLEKAGYTGFYEPSPPEVRELIGAPYVMRLKSDGSCFFLGEGNVCEVYDLRPDTCRRYPFIVGEDFILVSQSCPGIRWNEKGDPEPYREASKRIATAIRRLI